ncbi:MAG: drug/metabolite transporter (DMT)-like permease [Verrucomicrobiales bacterium]|jgi:drug/metabolite transporter (DMT)-like permease
MVLFSGIVGFGIGDVALFLAYFRIGARFTILVNLCLAPVFGAIGEYLWMGQTVTVAEIASIVVIVVGLVLALRPDKKHPANVQPGMVTTGACFAVVAGMGQGFGAVISRYADSLAVGAGVEMHGIGGGLAQAFVRTLGGLTIALICFAAYQWGAGRLKRVIPASAGNPVPEPTRLSDAVKTRGRHKLFPFWLIGAALTGPVLGVSCFQWALQSQKSAIVLAVTATSPLLVMLLARAFEKERTSPLAITGALISVSGVIAICLMKLPPEFWQ